MRIDRSFQNELATVEDHGFALSSEKKTPYVWVELSFNKWQSENGDKVTVKAYIYITDSALDYSLQKLAAMGWHGIDLSELDANDSKAVNLRGNKVLITGHIEDSPDGRKRPVVDFINDPNYSPDVPIDSLNMQTMSEKLKGKIAAFRSKNDKKLVSVEAGGKEKDEIPF